MYSTILMEHPQISTQSVIEQGSGAVHSGDMHLSLYSFEVVSIPLIHFLMQPIVDQIKITSQPSSFKHMYMANS